MSTSQDKETLMRTPFAATALLGLAVALAACSSGGGAATSAPATPEPATPIADAPTEAPAAAAAVGVASTSLGSVLAGADGLTLYVFLPDNAGASTCYDACATAWPPLLTEGAPTVGEGLVASDFATAPRTDGGSQVTFKGWPLYFFASDSAAGDVNGQGLNDKWYVVGPDGTMIGAPTAEGVSVDVAATSLGDILVDGSGMTLYMFTADSAGVSACSGDCLANWPPLLAETPPTLGTGLDAGDFASITRDDGTSQVTFQSMPLYYFAGDQAAGDTNGQGVGDKWYVLGPDGTVIGAPAADEELDY